MINKILGLFKKEEYKIIGWARINDRKDLFDLRLQDNPYIDKKLKIPIYIKISDLN